MNSMNLIISQGARQSGDEHFVGCADDVHPRHFRDKSDVLFCHYCLCEALPWHPGDEAAKELLRQGLGQAAAGHWGLVNDHSAV